MKTANILRRHHWFLLRNEHRNGPYARLCQTGQISPVSFGFEIKIIIIIIIYSFITNRIDYYNSPLYGLPNSHIMKLQRIQNAAARLVTGTPRFCHVTPLLFHLHWLPISYRIKFKILLLTFKCLYGQAPNYLIDLITIKKQSRYSLRSNESIFLELPGIKTHPTLGDRAFQSAAPYLWNTLPSAIRNVKTWDTFKTAVKTHFLNLAFK